ncbi:MAG: hypothetical protein HC828_03170 [Blastochloris sp.]|nr:hypothetical protein [Blastochloris sp.]
MLRQGVSEDMLDFMDERKIPFVKALAFLNKGKTVEELAHFIKYVPVQVVPDAVDHEAPPVPTDHHASVVAQQPGPPLLTHIRGIVAPAPSRKHKGATPKTHTKGGLDELVADGGLVVIAVSVWVLNGFFTAWAVSSIMPSNMVLRVVGFLMGVVFHYWISRVEYAYLNKERIFSLSAGPLLVCLAIDIGTTLQGLLDFMNQFFPQALGAVPGSVFAWRPLLDAFMAQGTNLIRHAFELPIEQEVTRPAWSGDIVVYLLIAIVLAIGSERFLRWSWHRLQLTRGVGPTS